LSTLLEYECQPPVGGYEVITVVEPPKEEVYVKPGDRMLQARSDRTKRFNFFEVRPSASPAFLELAQMPDTEDAIKDFADRYGPLWPLLPMEKERYSRIGLPWGFVSGLLIKDWRGVIRRMHQAVKLWETSRRTRNFSKLIRTAMEEREGFKRRVTRGVATYLSLKEDPVSRSARLCLRQETLEAPLWAEFFLAIDGNMNLGTCVQCRKWFPLEAGRGRSDKVYCSDACRMRAYRKRKKG
jgi:hypothetical protein